MIEALAAALLLGGVNTLSDFASSELRLETRRIYAFVRIALICYCVGGIVGARAKQLLIGTVGGLMIGALVAAAYYLLVPASGWGALVAAWVIFWVAFSLLEAVLNGGSAGGALLQGLIAAALSGAAFYAITGIWVEPSSRDPNYLRVLASWTGAFFPGFIVLFWHRL
jgi:hypothetical protein